MNNRKTCLGIVLVSQNMGAGTEETPRGRIENARKAKNNAIAILDHQMGNLDGFAEKASLAVELSLKALRELEADDDIDLKGHNLGEIYRAIRAYDISEFETLVYSIDGIYTDARYNKDFHYSEDVDIENPEELLNKVKEFVNRADKIVSRNGRKEKQQIR